MKFYKAMAIPMLLYGSETWVINKKDVTRIQSEMKFLRSVKRCTRMDRIKNDDIKQKLDIYAIKDKIKEYKTRWKDHMGRMEEHRCPILAYKYNPREKRDVGRPRKK